MQLYELTYLTDPALSQEEADALQEKIKSWVKEVKGSLTKAHSPVKKELAYEIKRKKDAYLSGLIFDLEPSAIKDMENKIKAEPSVIRYLVIKKEPEKFEIKATFRAKRPKKPTQAKVELEEIEKKLEEILGEENS